MIKKPVNCQELWQKCLVCASQVFVKLCHGISGEVGKLTIDSNYIPEKFRLPIDTLIVDLTKDVNESEEEDGLNEFGSDVAFI